MNFEVEIEEEEANNSIISSDREEEVTSHREQVLLNVMPRFSALISLWCAILLITSILRSKYYRNRIYHRINLGCGLNIILLCVLKLWG